MKTAMKIPFGTISVNRKARTLIARAVAQGRLSSGRYVRELEKRFAGILGVREAVAVSSGTDADALALAVLYDFGAKRGDEVIVPALSFAATGHAVLQAGFTPVFVDVERETLNIDPALIERAVTPRTRAIMPVHLKGKPAAMESIGRIARKHRLLVVEDAAEAHGAVLKGKAVGAWGDMAAFSLYVAHIITSIEGGIVVTDRPEMAAILRSLRCHGRACKCKTCVVNTASGRCAKRFKYGRDIRFVFERIGFSAKMNELEAAVGLGGMEDYDKILRRRRHNLLKMMEGLRPFGPHLTTFREDAGEKIGPHAFPVIVAPDAPFSRDELVRHLDTCGIDTRDLFTSMPTQCPGFAFLGHKLGDFPEAEFIGAHGLHIGVHQDITDKHIAYLMTCLSRFLKRKKCL